ncbi:transcription factor A, mitochondrial-like [Diorhabda carinulata]|uniref:transcription factor A, mitochondrial-like n=1 Tax=Diorhabda carinulata TaxID=1163345 RepID=UPI0025A00290|nr:transcription factor A, mitochondrial-like [Diorhabda carinulata]XP_057665527.1 transcription factor A, mitochondrial-like [Diorhabda carinulata]
MAGQGFLLKTANFINGWLLSTNRVCLIANQNSVRTLKAETRERLKSLKIPDKPKKPLNPYMLFVVETRSNLIKENPNLKPVDVFKKVAQQWKTITEEQKAKYQEIYKKEQEIYDQEVLDYNISLSEEQREALHAASMEKREEKKKRKLTKLIKENHKPKKPPGPYLLYLIEQSQIKNIPINILMKSSKDEWSKVPETEKQRFKNVYSKEVEKYEKELKNWEQKMLEEGHPELVRTKSKTPEKSSRILAVKHKKE